MLTHVNCKPIVTNEEIQVTFGIYREVLTFVDQFMATDVPLAARHIQILLMNQYSCLPITFGMK
jgi:hypothetical protein